MRAHYVLYFVALCCLLLSWLFFAFSMTAKVWIIATATLGLALLVTGYYAMKRPKASTTQVPIASPQQFPPLPTEERPNVHEKEIVREEVTKKEVIVKIRCPYCRKTYDETLDICPHCGAHR